MQLPFEPMLLERVARPFADDGWIYQVKWDGVRNLTLIEEGRIWHWSRSLRDRTIAYPELDGLARLIPDGRTVLDGEIIAMRAGKPSFNAILERDQLSRRPDSTKLQSTPAVFMIFDLLEYQGAELYARPLEERLGLLEQVIEPTDSWQVVTTFPGSNGPDLFAATMAQGMEGVVAKRRASRYQPGTRSGDWLKIKRRQETLAVVCGYTAPVGRAGGLLLGAYRAGVLRYIGRVGSGVSSADLTTVKASLTPSLCPFPTVPSLRDRFSGPPGPVVWAEPHLTVRVAYTEWTEEGKLRDPALVGFTTEPPDAAQIS